jgi:hypothetical protein
MPSSTYHFLDRCIIIKTMAYKCGIREGQGTSVPGHDANKRIKKEKGQLTLQHVDIIELQAFQALLHRIKDVLPALAILVHVTKAVGILRTIPGIKANREV